MSMERADKVFTVVFTLCLLAAEFIASLPRVSGQYEVLWWLLAPAAGFVGLILLMRRIGIKPLRAGSAGIPARHERDSAKTDRL